MLIGVIPARSNSKRIKNKNIKKFNGKPIIAWTIEAAKKANIFEKIIVSTDSEKIAKIAKRYGADVPFIRPSEISDDYSTVSDVINHAIKFFKNKKYFKYFCLMYAAAPFISPKDLINGFKKIKDKRNFDFVISMNQIESRFLRGVTQNNNKIYPLNKKMVLKRSQDLPKIYVDSAQFAFGKTEAWLKRKHPFLSKSTLIEIPEQRAIDIDNISDWKIAQKKIIKPKIKRKNNRKKQI